MLDFEPAATVCSPLYHEPDGVEQFASALATTVPAEHVIVQSALASWLDAVVVFGVV